MMIVPIALLVVLCLAFVFAKGVKNKRRDLMLAGGIPLLLAVVVGTMALAYTKLDAFEIHRLESSFNSDSSRNREGAIQVLSTEAAEDGCLPVILRALQDSDQGVRRAAHSYLRRRYGDLVAIPKGISLSKGYDWSSEYEAGSKDPFDIWVEAWGNWLRARIGHEASKVQQNIR